MDQPKKGKKFHTNRNGFVQAFLHTTKRINRLDKQFRLVSTCYFFPKNLKKKVSTVISFFVILSPIISTFDGRKDAHYCRGGVSVIFHFFSFSLSFNFFVCVDVPQRSY
jgi:hypothetical protein